MRRAIHNDGLALLQQGEQAQPGAISEAQMLGLPEPMQRYLSIAGLDKAGILHTCLIEPCCRFELVKLLPAIAMFIFTWPSRLHCDLPTDQRRTLMEG